jgi:hypothetical protein
MINCNICNKDSTFGSDLFCTSCGMDIGLSPVKIKRKGIINLYCCERCINI